MTTDLSPQVQQRLQREARELLGLFESYDLSRMVAKASELRGERITVIDAVLRPEDPPAYWAQAPDPENPGKLLNAIFVDRSSQDPMVAAHSLKHEIAHIVGRDDLVGGAPTAVIAVPAEQIGLSAQQVVVRRCRSRTEDPRLELRAELFALGAVSRGPASPADLGGLVRAFEVGGR
jgi:hypothetical protein